MEVVKLLVSLGADINALAWGNRSVLDIAVNFGHVELVDYLLDIGAKSGLAELTLSSVVGGLGGCQTLNTARQINSFFLLADNEEGRTNQVSRPLSRVGV